MIHLPLSKQARQGTKALFFIQIFSTLSFSVLYSTLLLYATNELKLPSSLALGITGSFVAFNFFLHLLGGYIGGRFLSYRFLFILGMIAQAIGCIVISFSTFSTLLWGLASFLTGCGLNVTCINFMLTQLFMPHDKNRELAFLWNYSGMNIGFLIGFIVSGIFQLQTDYPILFLIAGLSPLVALVIIRVKWNIFHDIDTFLTQKSSTNQLIYGLFGCLILLALIIVLRLLLEHHRLSNMLILIVGGLMGLIMILLAIQEKDHDMSKKLWGFLILIIASLIFWTLYQMAPMGLTLFLTWNVNRDLFGYIIPPQWMLAINTIIIIIGGPVMGHVNKKLRKKGYIIRIPVQFALALFLIGIGFTLLPLGIHFANSVEKTALIWVFISYLLQSLGELFISPIGYAIIGQLIAKKHQGLFMGIWLMTTGVAATLSNTFSQLTLSHITTNNPLQTNPLFSHTFNMLGWSAIIGGFILFCLTPFLKKLIKEQPWLPHINPHPYNAPAETP